MSNEIWAEDLFEFGFGYISQDYYLGENKLYHGQILDLFTKHVERKNDNIRFDIYHDFSSKCIAGIVIYFLESDKSPIEYNVENKSDILYLLKEYQATDDFDFIFSNGMYKGKTRKQIEDEILEWSNELEIHDTTNSVCHCLVCQLILPMLSKLKGVNHERNQTTTNK